MQELVSGKMILATKTRLCPLNIKDDSWEVFRWANMLLGLKIWGFEWHYFYSWNTWATWPGLSSFTTGLRHFAVMLIISCVSQPQLRSFICNDNKQWWALGRGQWWKVKWLISSVVAELVEYQCSFKSINYWWQKFAAWDFYWAQVSSEFMIQERQESKIPHACRRQSPL